MTDRHRGQVERFAPGFRDRILARSVVTAPPTFERHNANLVGGDITGGARPRSLVRPVTRPRPVRDAAEGRLLVLFVHAARRRRARDVRIPRRTSRARHTAAMRVLGAALLVAATGAGIAGAAGPSIRPGVGIAAIRLGMTEAQLRVVLGRPEASHREPSTFGRVRAVLQYDGTTYTVILDGRPGALRVTAVSTTLARHRSPEGFGVGTPNGPSGPGSRPGSAASR